MRAVAVLAIVALLAGAASAFPKAHQLHDYTFDQWLAEAGRSYAKGSPEYHRRKEIFEAKLKDIKRHNADPTQTWRRGVNQFSDWTAAEFKAYNTYQKRPHPTKEKAAFLGSSSGPQLPIAQINATGATIPGAVDWRRANPPVLTAVKNQGHCGSCWAHSTVEGVESFFALKYGQLPVLAAQQVASCDDNMYGCGGGDYFSGWNYIFGSKGLNEEWSYPYVDFWAKNMSKAATATCKNITKEWFPNWGWFPKANATAGWAVEPNNATAAMESLALHGPLSISVGAAGWDSYEGGIFTNPLFSNASWEIDHAVQLVGYGHDIDMDMDYWIVRNSWGTTWGESGFIRLWRPKEEPCSPAIYGPVCGTSGVLSEPAFPDVAMLKHLN